MRLDQDLKLQRAVAAVLRTGVLTASAVTSAGILIYLFHARGTVDYRFFHANRAGQTITGILAGAASFNGEAVIQLGLLLLILTPVVRVALAGLGFAFERDWLYTSVSSIVLAILLFSLWLR